MSAFSQLSPEERDARITSLLLGELSPSEAEELRSAIAADSELARACERRERTIALLREAACRQHPAGESSVPDVPEPIPARLSDDRREKLLEMFRSATPVDDEPRRRPIPSWFMPMAAAALLIGMLGLAALSTTTRSRKATTTEYRTQLLSEDLAAKGSSEEFAAGMSAEQVRLTKESLVSRVQNSGQAVEFSRRSTHYANGSPVAGASIVADPVQDQSLGEGTLSRFKSQTAPMLRSPVKVEIAGNEYFAKSLSEELATPSVVTVGVSDKVKYPPSPVAAPTPPALNAEFEIARSGAATAPDAARATPLDSNGEISNYLITTNASVVAFASDALGATVSSAFSVVNGSSGNFVNNLGQNDSLRDGLPATAPVQSSAAGSGNLSWSSRGEAAGGAIQNPAKATASGPEAKPRLAAGGGIASVSEGFVVNGSFDDELQRKTGKDKPTQAGGAGGAKPSDTFGSESFAIDALAQRGVVLVGTNFNSQPTIAAQSDPRGLGLDWYEKNGRATGLSDGQANTSTHFYDFSGQGVAQSGGARVADDDRAVRYANDSNLSLVSSNTPWGGIALGDTLDLFAGTQLSQSERRSRLGGGDIGGVQEREWGLKSPTDAFGNSLAGMPSNRPATPSSSAPRWDFDSDGSYVVVAGVSDAVGLPIVGNEAKQRTENRVGQTAAVNESAEARKLRQEIDQLQSLRDRADSNLRLAKIDASAPKSGLVQVIEPAETGPREKPSLWGRVANAFGAEPERSVRLSVEPDMPDVDPQGRLAFRPVADPFSVQTEMERIQSTNVLTKVIEDLKLDEAWAEKRDGEQKLSEEETLARLKKKVSVRPVSQSSLVDIGVKSESPEEAARIANKIAEVYSEKRAAARPKVLLEGLQALEKNISEQDKQIALKREELRRFQKQPNPPPTNDIASKPAAASAPVPQPEVLTRDNAFSTFSLNVSDVSFKLAAASLEKGAMPDVASIRSEEFVNAFDYRDPQPVRGAPLAFAWDRARYPFAHNRDVVRFSVKTAAQGRESGKPLNIVVLLDNSGSMERADRVRIIQQSLQTLASQLKPQDKLSVVTFARTASLRVDGLIGTNALEAVKQIGVITPEGGTNLEDALDLAYRTALRHYEATAANRVVLLTDGAANLGNVEPKELKAKVEGFRKQGIALDCFGIGWEGLNDDLLEQLSRNGDGRYGFVNTPEEAASEFVGQLAGALQVAASDVKMQVEFNPRRVTAYRQVGYAKHQLTKEQFRDNNVDAAEIGAAESGNALYVIETNPNGEGPIATVRARFRIPQTSDYREHEWIVPFGSAVELEQANPALRLSAGAAAFSEWLSSSPFAGDVTTDRLLRILSGVPETYGADPRPKRLEWMVRQAKSISGK